MATFPLLRNETDVRVLRSGDVIFAQGDVGDAMFTVLEGEVEIRRGDRVLEIVGAGGIFGEMALIDQQPRSACAVAACDCRIAAVGQRRFTALVQQTPFVALEIMRVLVDRLRQNTSS